MTRRRAPTFYRPHPRRWRAAPALAAIVLAANAATYWRFLVAVPTLGGPLVALAAGAVGWLLAGAAVPRPRLPTPANDNEVWPLTQGRRAKRVSGAAAG